MSFRALALLLFAFLDPVAAFTPGTSSEQITEAMSKQDVSLRTEAEADADSKSLSPDPPKTLPSPASPQTQEETSQVLPSWVGTSSSAITDAMSKTKEAVKAQPVAKPSANVQALTPPATAPAMAESPILADQASAAAEAPSSAPKAKTTAQMQPPEATVLPANPVISATPPVTAPARAPKYCSAPSFEGQRIVCANRATWDIALVYEAQLDDLLTRAIPPREREYLQRDYLQAINILADCPRNQPQFRSELCYQTRFDLLLLAMEGTFRSRNHFSQREADRLGLGSQTTDLSSTLKDGAIAPAYCAQPKNLTQRAICTTPSLFSRASAWEVEKADVMARATTPANRAQVAERLRIAEEPRSNCVLEHKAAPVPCLENHFDRLYFTSQQLFESANARSRSTQAPETQSDIRAKEAHEAQARENARIAGIRAHREAYDKEALARAKLPKGTPMTKELQDALTFDLIIQAVRSGGPFCRGFETALHMTRQLHQKTGNPAAFRDIVGRAGQNGCL